MRYLSQDTQFPQTLYTLFYHLPRQLRISTLLSVGCNFFQGHFSRSPLVKPWATELPSCTRDYSHPNSQPEQHPLYPSGSRWGQFQLLLQPLTEPLLLVQILQEVNHGAELDTHTNMGKEMRVWDSHQTMIQIWPFWRRIGREEVR